jgi:hypothetical protein
MNNRVEVHIHIHEGASAAAAEAAVKAALGSPDTAPKTVLQESNGNDDPEKIHGFWVRSYVDSATDSEGKARPLLRFLAENPERLIPYTEVSKKLGFGTPRSLPGLLGAFGRRADHRYQGVWPFERKWANGQWNLWMSREAADIIGSLAD